MHAHAGPALLGSRYNPIAITNLASSLPYTYTGTSAGLLNDFTQSYCGLRAGPTAVFTFSVTSAIQVTFSTCNTGTATKHALMLGVTTDDCPDSVSFTSGGSCGGPSYSDAILENVSLQPSKVYLLVADSDTQAGGVFRLTITT